MAVCCRLCGHWVNTPGDMADGMAVMISHLDVEHPDYMAAHPWERWPDGDVVVEDQSLSPEEFQ